MKSWKKEGLVGIRRLQSHYHTAKREVYKLKAK